MTHIKSLSRSTIWTIAFITIITIASELSKSFKIFLASMTGHHWVSKSILSIILFGLLYILLSAYKDSIYLKKETYYVIGSTIICGLAIFVFYVWHFLG